MSRWQKRIDNLLADFERETTGAEDFRINIDQKISEAEAAVSKPHDEEAFALAEKPQQRRREFLEALRPSLIARQSRDPSNVIWSEALLLLDNPQLRVFMQRSLRNPISCFRSGCESGGVLTLPAPPSKKTTAR